MADTASNRNNFTKLGGFGFRVDRAAATLPQGVAGALFTITGGRIALTCLIGEVTVAIANTTNATKLVLDMTATGTDQDLCATLDIDNDAVGELYTISGTVGDAMRSDLLIGLSNLTSAPLILSEGDIELNCGGSIAGEIGWSLWYYPLDLGASVASA